MQLSAREAYWLFVWPGKQGKTKIKTLWLLVIFNSLSTFSFTLIKAVLFAAFQIYRCHVDVWSVYYVFIYWCVSQPY